MAQAEPKASRLLSQASRTQKIKITIKRTIIMTKNPITLDQLSPEDKAALIAQAKQEEVQKKQDRIDNRAAYKKLVNETVPSMFLTLAVANEALGVTKQRIFKEAEQLIALKKEAYDVKEGQQSHTFSNENGTQSITIGYRVTDSYDDTLQPGIDKVNQFITGLVKDEDTQKLVNTINRLLQKDANGNLKSSRVLELQKIAQEFNSDLLNDAIQIIGDAYKPQRSCYFVEASFTDGTGKKQSVPLSISTVDLPEGTKIDFI